MGGARESTYTYIVPELIHLSYKCLIVSLDSLHLKQGRSDKDRSRARDGSREATHIYT